MAKGNNAEEKSADTLLSGNHIAHYVDIKQCRVSLDVVSHFDRLFASSVN